MNRMVVVLLATNVGVAVASWQVVRELHAERENARVLLVRVAQLERAARQTAAMNPFVPEEVLTATLPEPRSEPADRQAPEPDPSVAAKPVEAQAADPQEERTRRMQSLERHRLLMRDPEYLEAWQTQQRAMLPARYPDLATELGLTPDEVDRLMTLLLDQQVRSMKERGAFEVLSDPAMAEALQRKSDVLQKSFDEEIRSLLGDEKWRQWRDYQSSIGVRHEVARIDTMLAGKGNALSQDQIKPLRQALVEAQQELMREWTLNAPPDPAEAASVAQLDTQLSRMRAHSDSVRDAASSILTPEQMQYLIEHQDSEMKLQEAHMRMMYIRMMRMQRELQKSEAIPHL